MALRRYALFAAVMAVILFLVLRYPEQSFETFAGLLITFSTASTLIFFAFVAVASLLGFDRPASRSVEQAQPLPIRR